MPHSVLQHMPRQILGTFISCVFKFERADLAVACCAKGDDSSFGIFAFPREKTSITKTPDKWDTACVLTAPVGSSSTRTRVRVAAKHSKAVLHRSCQGLDVPSAVPGHIRQSRQLWPQGPAAGVQLWHGHGKHGGKPGGPGRW